MRHRVVLCAALVLTGCFDLLYSPPYPLERQRIDRQSHTPIFPVAEGNHGGVDCDACHGPFPTFTRFTCIECHEHDQAATDPDHTGVAGYSYTPTSCYDCHPTGEGMSREAHAALFPITSGPHGTVACSDCHPQDKQSFVCTNCHEHTCSRMNDKHSEVSGYSCDSLACVACHPRGVAGGD